VSRAKAILELSRKIDRERTAEVHDRIMSPGSPWAAHVPAGGLIDEALAVAVLLAAVYPSLATPMLA